jgi:hypothetical protein
MHVPGSKEEAYPTIKDIKAGVSQGSVLGPIIYLLYTRDIPQEEDVTTATFADETAILSVGYSSEETATKLQEACIRINDWTRLWRMRINENKSVHIDFAYRIKQNRRLKRIKPFELCSA